MPIFPAPFAEQDAAWWSRLSLSWATPLLRTASTRSLDHVDLVGYSPPPDIRSNQASDFVDRAWGAAQLKAAASNAASSSRSSDPDRDASAEPNAGPNRSHAILPSLLRECRKPVLWSGLLFLLHGAGQLAAPLVLKRLILFLGNPDGGLPTGLGWAAALVLTVAVANVAEAHGTLLTVRFLSRIRAGLTGSVFRKVMRMRVTDLRDDAVGRMVNLVHGDCHRMLEFPAGFHTAWCAPLVILVGVALLYAEVGPTAFATLGTMFAFLPLVGWLTAAMNAAQGRTHVLTDARVGLTGSVVAGALVVKSMAWEGAMLAAVTRHRDAELDELGRFAFLKALSFAAFMEIPFCATLVTFLVFVGTGGTLTTARAFTTIALINSIRFPFTFLPASLNYWLQATVSAARIQQFLLMPEVQPSATGAVAGTASRSLSAALATGGEPTVTSARATVSAAVPLGSVRIAGADVWYSTPAMPTLQVATAGTPRDRQAQLQLAIDIAQPGDGAADAVPVGSQANPDPDPLDLNSEPATREREGEPARTTEGSDDRGHVEDLSDDAYGPSKPVLRNVELEVRPGELVVVMGRVGEGKTALLLSLLGETELVPRSALSRGGGRTAYASQEPFVLNATLRDNVLMGLPLDPVRYREVLSACCLDADVAALRAGDLTELGERGSNLSGGQRQRLGLARAAYDADADLVVLDEPLSAVDASVAARVRQACVLGLMAGKTRVVATSSFALARRADRVVVLESGRIREVGSFDELAARPGGALASMLLAAAPAAEEGQRNSNDQAPAPVAASAPAPVQLHGPVASGQLLQPANDASNVASVGHGPACARPVRVRRAVRAPSSLSIVSLGSFLAELDLEDAEQQVRLQPQDHAEDRNDDDNNNSSNVHGTGAGNGAAVVASSHAAFGPDTEKERAGVALLDMDCLDCAAVASKTTEAGVPGSSSTDCLVDVDVGTATAGLGDDNDSVCTATTAAGSSSSSLQVEMEARGHGRHGFGLYRRYLGRAGGPGTWLALAAAFATVQGSDVWGAWWIGQWASGLDEAGGSSGATGGDRAVFMGVYGATFVAACCVIAGRSFLVVRSGLRASRSLHAEALASVLSRPLAFFEVTPVGRILGRFGRDLFDVDVTLPQLLENAAASYFAVAAVVIVLVAASPVLVVLLVPAAWAYRRVERWYCSASRDLQRLESVSRGPVAAHLAETAAGAATVRALGAEEAFAEAHAEHADLNQMSAFLTKVADTWLALRLGAASALVLAVASAVAVQSASHPGDALTGVLTWGSAVGASGSGMSGSTGASGGSQALSETRTALWSLVLTYTLLLGYYLGWAVQISVQVEARMTSVERLVEYAAEGGRGEGGENDECMCINADDIGAPGVAQSDTVAAGCGERVQRTRTDHGDRDSRARSAAGTTTTTCTTTATDTKGLDLVRASSIGNAGDEGLLKHADGAEDHRGGRGGEATICTATTAAARARTPSGHVRFEHVTMRYRSDLPPALCDVTLEAPAGSRVALVGRTGSAKSTVLRCLLRLNAVESGRVELDGVDVCDVPLKQLRTSLALVPQNPTVFWGTVRFNLDPMGVHTDDELWAALDAVGLGTAVRGIAAHGKAAATAAAVTAAAPTTTRGTRAHAQNQPSLSGPGATAASRVGAGTPTGSTALAPGLSASLGEEGGTSLSAGQNQLLCLARAYLRHPRVVCLDEATAAMDAETDAEIQQALRTRFAGCTIITVAHRLHTVADYDKIIVMEGGRVAESGPPATLAADPSSQYSSMLRAQQHP